VRRLALLAVALCLGLITGVARADVFAVLPSSPSVLTLPSSDVPNVAGTVAVPSSIMSPPAAPQQLSQSALLALWQRAGAAYDVPWQVLGAINKIESNFGRNMGPSSAGAIGWMQFMPDTWYRWGVDADGDGVADPWNPSDAVFSAARYLAAAGGASDISRAVYAYNHAEWYVNEVLGLANLYSADRTVAFTLDRLQENLDAARRTLAAAGERLAAAHKDARAARVTAAHWRTLATRAPLLSDRLADEQRAARAETLLAGALARSARLEQSVAAAREQLVQANRQAAPASFASAAAPLLGAPSVAQGYVFPVGGGAGTVSASHSHHDYPAVDIAAPMGAPLYALTAGTVVNAWTTPDPRCGIGFTIRAAVDRRVWTYCHLSVLDQAVVRGAGLTTGQPVGLVGATGDATGPHLHLQLHPATSWPQQEPWFAAFAGTAFRWSDGAADSTGYQTFAATTAAPADPVFAVVPDDQAGGGVVYFSAAH
jgi:murein DD-endopeptidase MepM/ murein hydrolase activator NlpD